MLLKSLLKNPILGLGILFFIIFILDLERRNGFLKKRAESVQAVSCRGVLVMLNRRIPETWETKCEGNNLAVEVEFQAPSSNGITAIKTAMYRDLANHLQFISKNSLPETLENVGIVRFKIMHEKLDINAVTNGESLARLRGISNPKFLAEQLQTTVRVQERLK